MDFSQFAQFAQMLYPFLGDGVKDDEFIITLIDNIMEDSDGMDNPLYSYEENTLKKFYKGTTIFSRSNASKILTRIDADKFADYLNTTLTWSAQQDLIKSLNTADNTINEQNYNVKCAELFVAILKKIVAGTQAPKTNKAENASTQLSIYAPKLRNDKSAMNKFCNNNFLPDSRAAEINQIKDIFKYGEYNIVVLSGFGGIGKSEIAKRYAHINQDNYDYIYLLEYKHSMQATINSRLIIENFTADQESSADQQYTRKLEFLKTLDKKTLIIIDNFDICAKTENGEELTVPAIADNHFREFAETINCHLIFTTSIIKAEIDKQNSPLKTIEIKPLDADYCLKLFDRHYKSPLNDAERKDISKLIEDLQGNTLLIILLANIMRVHREIIPADNIAEQFSQIRSKTTQIRREKSFHENLSSLFDFSVINEHKQYILGCLSFFPDNGVQKSLFGKWNGITNDYTDLNQLIATSWIIENIETGVISLYPAIKEVVALKIKPDLKKYKKLTDSFIESVENYNANDSDINIITAEIGKNLCKHIDESEHRNTLENACIYSYTGDIFFNMQQCWEAVDLYIKAEEILHSLNQYDEHLYKKIYVASTHTPSCKPDKLSAVLNNEYAILKSRIPVYLQRLICITSKLSPADNHKQTLQKLQEAFDAIKQIISE